MSSVVIAGNTSGSITISAPDVSGSNTLTLPVATDTLVGKATTDTLTNKTLVNPTITDLQTLNTPNTFGFKNRIINGGMVIDQRNAGASVTPGAGQYTVDRWQCTLAQSGKYTAQQQLAGALGFTNCVKLTSTSSYSILSTDYFNFSQPIEGYNISDLYWGGGNAATVTLSFRLYTSLTGTFGGAINNATLDRSYPFSYSIPTANVWTTISVTIPGCLDGTWNTTNGVGMYIRFGLGMGSTYSGTAGAWASTNYGSSTGATSVVGTSGATFYITGVQLEKGSTATSFDFRDYGRELAMCQRYFQLFSTFGMEGHSSGANVRMNTPMTFPVQMRATPTRTVITAGSYVNIRSNSSTYAGLGINGLTSTYSSCSMESAGAGFMSIYNQSESMSAEL